MKYSYEQKCELLDERASLQGFFDILCADAYGVGQRPVLRSKTAAERSEWPPVYYKKVVILL